MLVEVWRRAVLALFVRESCLEQDAADLRVCWWNLAPTGNCSMCHKCERAMVAIAAYGRAEDFTVFDRTVSLADRLDALPPLPLMHRVLRHTWWLRRRRP